jgi:SAM-dependent methyltransferase
MPVVPRSQDAYGAEIRAYYDAPSDRPGATPFEIVERDDGYIGLSRGPQRYFSPFDRWPHYEREALTQAQGRVLDLGCGAGRHSLYLKSRGHEVVPMDSSPGAVKVCHLRGLDEARLASIEDIDPSWGRFDTFLMLGNNFGLFHDADTCRTLLRRFRELGNPGARILAESMDPTATTNPDHLQYHERNRAAGRMPGQLRIRIRYERIVGPWFDYLLVSQTEMRELVESAGWKLERVIEGVGGAFVGIVECRA